MRNKYFSLVFRMVLGGLFVYASFDKIVHPSQFVTAVENYRIMPGLLSFYTALFLPWLELICGLFLIAGVFVESAAGLIGLLLLVFIAALFSALSRGLSIDCGCFGSGANGASVSVKRLLEDAGMLFMAGYLFWFYEPWLALFSGKNTGRNV